MRIRKSHKQDLVYLCLLSLFLLIEVKVFNSLVVLKGEILFVVVTTAWTFNKIFFFLTMQGFWFIISNLLIIQYVKLYFCFSYMKCLNCIIPLKGFHKNYIIIKLYFILSFSFTYISYDDIFHSIFLETLSNINFNSWNYYSEQLRYYSLTCHLWNLILQVNTEDNWIIFW